MELFPQQVLQGPHALHLWGLGLQRFELCFRVELNPCRCLTWWQSHHLQAPSHGICKPWNWTSRNIACFGWSIPSFTAVPSPFIFYFKFYIIDYILSSHAYSCISMGIWVHYTLNLHYHEYCALNGYLKYNDNGGFISHFTYNLHYHLSCPWSNPTIIIMSHTFPISFPFIMSIYM
jgi:hypothetical protein